MRTIPLRPLSRRLVAMLWIYCLAGVVSQKLVPGVDEIFPFFGWSLFSKVPNEEREYQLILHRSRGQRVKPPTSFLEAPDNMVRGNRFIARKLIQRLGRAQDRGDVEGVTSLRRLLEQSYLQKKSRYELVFERYDPLEKWRDGSSRERRSLAIFNSGKPLETHDTH